MAWVSFRLFLCNCLPSGIMPSRNVLPVGVVCCCRFVTIWYFRTTHDMSVYTNDSAAVIPLTPTCASQYRPCYSMSTECGRSVENYLCYVHLITLGGIIKRIPEKSREWANIVTHLPISAFIRNLRDTALWVNYAYFSWDLDSAPIP